MKIWGGERYLDQMLEDWFEIFEFSVVEWVDAFTTLIALVKEVHLRDFLVFTGNFHLVSHNALIPSWCGMRASNLSPKIQLVFGFVPFTPFVWIPLDLIPFVAILRFFCVCFKMCRTPSALSKAEYVSANYDISTQSRKIR